MTDLSIIRRLARSGAVDRAWAAFVAAGLDAVVGDERVLTLKGRLLKDRALTPRDGREGVGDADRAALLRGAAEAYAAAAALGNDSYPRINAAALVYLRGDQATAAMLAGDVLAMIDSGQHSGETPYWLEATRAEAFLLMRRVSDVQAALKAAVELAPHAREDRAATLRQMRRLLAAGGDDERWLDGFALPPVMHFRGPMGSIDEVGRTALTAAVSGIAPGIAYGAVAAGTDIIVAEAAMAGGAELHIVLPCGPDTFRAQSVAPHGDDWVDRFDVLTAAATSVEWIDEPGGLTDAAVVLAEMMATGLAAGEALATDSAPHLLRAHWANAGDAPSLASAHPATTVALGPPEAMARVALPQPDAPQLAIWSLGDAQVRIIPISELPGIMTQLQPGDCIDVFVPDPGGDAQLSPRLAAMRGLADSDGVLASRPAALLLMAWCADCRPALIGSGSAPTGPFDLYDVRV